MKGAPKEVKYKKEFESKFGTMHTFAVLIPINGKDEWAVYNSKSKDQSKFVKGQEVEYTAIEKEYNGRKYYQIKPEFSSRQYGSNFSRALKKEQSKYSGFACSYAKDLVVADKVKLSDMMKMAKVMMDWMVEQDKNLENG